MIRGKNILVTGGAGYIGSVLVPRLLGAGYNVRVLDKLVFGDFGLSSVRSHIELIPGDIMNPPSGIMNNVYGLIHLAGLSSQGKASYHSPRYTDRVNHEGTEIVAREAKKHGVERFVFASSCSIYCSLIHQPTKEQSLVTEDDVVEIHAPYALSKRAAEEVLLELSDQDFRPTILRMGTLYGYSPKMRYDLVLNAFTKDAFRQRKITVNAGGIIYRPLVDIQDVVEAYVHSLELPSEVVGTQIFNVFHKNVMLGSLAETFGEEVRKIKNIEVEIDVKPFAPALSYSADNKKFMSAYRFKPKRTMSDAIGEIWSALERGSNFDDPRFYNDLWHYEALKRGLL